MLNENIHLFGKAWFALSLDSCVIIVSPNICAVKAFLIVLVVLIVIVVLAVIFVQVAPLRHCGFSQVLGLVWMRRRRTMP